MGFGVSRVIRIDYVRHGLDHAASLVRYDLDLRKGQDPSLQ